MKREYTAFAKQDHIVRDLLQKLADTETNTPPDAYKEVMLELGRHLAKAIALKASENHVKNLYLACTVEDADYLAKGIIDELEELNTIEHISIACFWNERFEQFDGVNAAPIIRKYVEPHVDGQSEMLVVLKSIIASACVVRANLTNLINTVTPKNILVVSPVMYKDAEQNLKNEFSPDIAERFDFLTFAIDSEMSEGKVLPGIGGDVYKRLGFNNQSGKNKFTPLLVKQRRQSLPRRVASA